MDIREQRKAGNQVCLFVFLFHEKSQFCSSRHNSSIKIGAAVPVIQPPKNVPGAKMPGTFLDPEVVYPTDIVTSRDYREVNPNASGVSEYSPSDTPDSPREDGKNFNTRVIILILTQKI